MLQSNLNAAERRNIEAVVARAAHPAFEMLQDHGLLEGMRPDTARDTFYKLLPSAIELVAGHESPTDEAFARYGGPGPDRARRFLQNTNLEFLPAAHVAYAAQEQLVAPPTRLILESRTERVTGPEKYAAVHRHPPAIDIAARLNVPGVRHSSGGISSMLAFADCGEIPLPCGLAPIPQGWWLPDNWLLPDLRAEIEQQLRERAGLAAGESLTGNEIEIASRLLQRLTEIADLDEVDLNVDGLVVTGGRMRVGYPIKRTGTFGAAEREKYLGCDLVALAEIRRHRLVPFLELPSPRAAKVAPRGVTTEPCQWHFRVGGVDLDLATVEGMLRSSDSPWAEIDPDIVAQLDRSGGLRIHRLATEASASGVPSMSVQLVAVTDARGRHSLHVTTMIYSEEPRQVEELVRVAVAEKKRKAAASPYETSVQSLLCDGRVQSNQRRRHRDRCGHANLLQVAYAALQIARSTSDS